MLDERDFAEKLAAAFEDAIQSEHWQNTSMTIETSMIECFKKEVVTRSCSRVDAGRR